MKSVGEGKMQYASTAADTKYYNIAKDLAQLNARNEEVTDRKGNLYGYWCRVSTTSIANDLLVLASVPNTWKVRNAFRKFHFAREHMFRESGVTKKEMGKYGRTIRPYLSKDHISTGDQPLRLFDSVNLTPRDATGGEWTYTKLASAPSFLESQTGTSGLPVVDAYTLTVMGDHDVDQTSTADNIFTWDSVGMVMAYNEDRMEQVPDATTATAILSPNNPLAAIRSQSVTSGEVTEIAEDQELEAPPYDVIDNGDAVDMVWDYMPVAGTSGATAQHRSWGLFFFPAGIIALQNSADNSNALELEVLGKELCKDVA